jgi:hypothetical protein
VSVRIERIEVEEGFLDGLVMEFGAGLNVLIGPRGTGKTSVIELLRFCLDVQAFTDESAQLAQKHALEVLGTGRVIVTVNVDGHSLAVSRSATEKQPHVSQPTTLNGVTVLSQKEVEQVALDDAGRLRLIDEYAPQVASVAREERLCVERVRSLSTELRTQSLDNASLKDVVQALAAVRAELEAAQLEEAELLGSVKDRKAEQEELQSLGVETHTLATRQSLLENALESLRDFEQRLRADIAAAPSPPHWPEDAGPDDQLEVARSLVAKAKTRLNEARSLFEQAVQETVGYELRNRQMQLEVGNRARELRRILDAAVKGAGAASARVSGLQERVGSLEPSLKRLAETAQRISTIQASRHQALDELDQLREHKFTQRLETAKMLNGLLGPRIDVRVIRYGWQSRYAAAIADTLRGTRLHYNQLAPILARSLSPRELVEAAESDDVSALVSITQLDSDRASRVLEAIRGEGGGNILSAPLEDSVQLRLLDGSDYKDTSRLSTGQRCTVVLPILLEQRSRVLVLDQPEDHLDNSFITETVVKAVLARPEDDQLIVATHNANVPVLGDAKRVYVMGSDGANGFVNTAGPLDDPAIVEAITRIMEGGWQAFEQRREFYRSHGQ